MAYTHPILQCLPEKTQEEKDADEKIYQNFKKIISNLPQAKFCGRIHYYYEGFWYPESKFGGILEGVMVAKQYFKARASDLLLATIPKSGTTWLKALAFAIVNRNIYTPEHHPLLTTNPHHCVPCLELGVYGHGTIHNIDILPSPRIFQTHMPFTSLPESIIDSGCRIVHLSRNPKDTFTSLWHFLKKLCPDPSIPVSLEETVELFCQGISRFGPIWDNMLSYWKASLERPQMVLFLKYEDIKKEPTRVLKRLAEFVGYPFSIDEEKEGIIEEISRLCSFETLSSLDVNKTNGSTIGERTSGSFFFREGKVGGWRSLLTAQMAERIDQITEQRLLGSGLTI